MIRVAVRRRLAELRAALTGELARGMVATSAVLTGVDWRRRSLERSAALSGPETRRRPTL